MIDIHSHVIYGVDDGPCSIEQSLSMIYSAQKAGIRVIVATPHLHENLFETDRLMEYYQEILYRIHDCEISICLGYEVFVNSSISNLEVLNKRFAIDKTRYLLFELPYNCSSSSLYEVLKNCKNKDIIPIIAHPERNRNLNKSFEDILNFISSGGMIQVDAASILGVYGRDVRDYVKKLMKNNMIDFVASNAHSAEEYEEWHLSAYKEVLKWTGEVNARRLFAKNAEAVLKQEAKIRVM